MLKPTDVPKPNFVFWLAEPGFVKVVQPEPRREVLFSGESARLWELIDAEEYTVTDLVALMAAEGVEEIRSLGLLEQFLSLGLLTSENFLWKEGDNP